MSTTRPVFGSPGEKVNQEVRCRCLKAVAKSRELRSDIFEFVNCGIQFLQVKCLIKNVKEVFTLYWNIKGSKNTVSTLEAALKRAGELGLKHIVVASCSGMSAELLLDRVKDFEIVCVTHQVGFYRPGEDEMAPETRKKLTEGGIEVLTATHLMAGLDRACRIKFGGVYPAEIVASALRMFGQGLKVCVEIAVMALDAGLIPHGVDIVAMAGTSEGLDTAAVIVPAHSQNFFDTKVKEIICKPREF